MTGEFSCLFDAFHGCWAFSTPTGFVWPELSNCWKIFCLVETAGQNANIFGFAEFVQAFALLVLVYTVSDSRSRYRVSIAPIRLGILIFCSSATIGLGTLITDVWFSQEWKLPFILSNQYYWQVVFGASFVLLVLIWIWYAFVSPPKFGRLNAYNFTRALYRNLLQGDDRDLPIVAGELARSASRIIHYAGQRSRRHQRGDAAKYTKTARYAQDILLLIANRKFCRHIIASSPGTAMAFFQAMSDQHKYRLPIGQFAANISTEALVNKESILYHEDAGYYSGFFGYVQPFTNAVFGDFALVEALTDGSSPLDVDLDVRWSFDAQQLEAYCRAVLTTFKSALAAGRFRGHSYALNRAFSILENACRDTYKLNDVPPPANAKDITDRLGAVVRFVNDAINALHDYGVQETRLRRHDEPWHWRSDLYDHLAHLMFEIIGVAAHVETRDFLSWDIHYSTVWTQFFSFDNSETRRLILFKLRRRLYEEVRQVETGPHFKNAAYLGYLLNIFGLTPGRRGAKSDAEYHFRRVILALAKRNYLTIQKYYPRVAKAVLIGWLSYDAKGKRLVKTYQQGLRGRAPKEYLALDPARSTPPRHL